MTPLPDFDRLIKHFDHPNVKAWVLMGSYARGTAGLFSDVDLSRFVSEGSAEQATPDGSYIMDGFLVTITTITPQQVEEWFSNPEMAVKVISGIRSARPLLDRFGTFEAVQRRARAFTWDAEMQRKANQWASQEMVGWIEEVHKGLEGLRCKDIGRMLNARFGCSWGLSNVMAVHKGVLITGDNSLYDEIGEAVGMHSEWARLRRTAFGIESQDGIAPTLREQVIAGLRLYGVTAQLLDSVLEPTDAVLVNQTIALIESELGSQ